MFLNYMTQYSINKNGVLTNPKTNSHFQYQDFPGAKKYCYTTIKGEKIYFYCDQTPAKLFRPVSLLWLPFYAVLIFLVLKISISAANLFPLAVPGADQTFYPVYLIFGIVVTIVLIALAFNMSGLTPNTYRLFKSKPCED